MKVLEEDKISSYSLYQIEQYFEKYRNVFNFVQTEHKRLSLLQKMYSYVPFEMVKMGITFEEKIVGNTEVFLPEPLFGAWLPL